MNSGLPGTSELAWSVEKSPYIKKTKQKNNLLYYQLVNELPFNHSSI